MTTIFLVGNAESAKNNSWLHMTNSIDKARELVSKIPEGIIQVKEVTPRKPKGGQK